MATTTKAPERPATFRDVFAVSEYRALWTAQLASIAGDQFARVALAVLIYDRTGSAALAAVAFAITAAAMTCGGLLLGWTADRYPRRTVMITCDVICTGLVLIMVIPGLPPGALLGLLFVVTLMLEPFMAARAVTNRAVLGPRRFPLGNSITMSTYQVAQLAGASLGGITVAATGTRTALLIDAASFAVSALIIRAGVIYRRPKWQEDGDAAPAARPARPEIWTGFRLVFSHPVARTAMLLMWVCAFAIAPEGVVAPLSRLLGGGTAGVGWLLAAMTAGAAIGPLVFSRLLTPATRTQLTALSATAASAVLIAFAASPPFGAALAILAGSGFFTGYLANASATLYNVIPDEHRGQAGGVVGAGLSFSQGVTIIGAGAAAEHLSPELVLAWAGLIGTGLALWLAVRWRAVIRDHEQLAAQIQQLTEEDHH